MSAGGVLCNIVLILSYKGVTLPLTMTCGHLADINTLYINTLWLDVYGS